MAQIGLPNVLHHILEYKIFKSHFALFSDTSTGMNVELKSKGIHVQVV